MKTIPRANRRTTKNFEAFFGGVGLPRFLAILVHCTRPCHLRDMPKHHQAVAKWFPAVIFLAAGFAAGFWTPGWIQLWIIAVGIFAATKWLTLIPILCSRRPASAKRLLAYCFLWPGLNANQFVFDPPPAKPRLTDFALPVAKATFGFLLIVASIQLKDSEHPLFVGWLAMLGIVFLLHFGFLHIVALFWQAQGVNAHPIMNKPLRATSLGNFWGARWNRAFSDFARDQILLPLRRRIPLSVAILMVFLISGLLHEAVISVPAKSGYGLPTGYFLLQGIGQFAERSEFGKQIGLGHGRTGWAFVALIAGVPAVLLFPPVFIRNVILPMLNAL